jgi:hypothetical protein
MSIALRVLATLAAFCAVQPGIAQPTASIYRAVQISQARQANAALMHHYTWTARTEIFVNGQLKDTRIEQVSYGPDSQLQRSLINDTPASGMYLPTPIGFLRRAVAANEKEQIEKFLHGLKGMVEQYTLPTTGKIVDFMAGATPSGPDANNLFQLTGSNVVQPGDRLTIWVNAWTRHIQRIQVNTSFEGASVQLSATFATVPGSGLNYAAYAEATVPDKQLDVRVQNYNYARFGY